MRMSSGALKTGKLKYIRGWPFRDTPWLTTENILAAMDYVPLDGDILLCSYPKTGTTWMHYIIYMILHKADSFPDFDDLNYRLVPYVEVTGIDAAKILQPPRFYKNHLPYHLMKTNPKSKFVYVYRHPSDTLVSAYHFNNTLGSAFFEFDDYFESFMKGEVSFGDYFDHFLSFYAHCNDENLHLVAYEDLHKDLRKEILKIAKFLGDDYYDALVEDEVMMAKILEYTSFDYMKKNLHLSSPSKEGGKRKLNFFRKGTAGEGKLEMSKEQRDRLQEKIAQKMVGTEFVERWS